MRDCTNILETIEAARERILAAERHIWAHPETGYKEWKTHAYLKQLFEELGYGLNEFGDIPGFYTDLDTGRPGPCLAIFGEMDALVVRSHPECDPDTGAVHACGHNCQSAALYGIAAGLQAPGALDGLSGKIRLIAVPAEELIELEYREKLREEGRIRFYGGKQELMARGILNDVDLSMMVHTTGSDGYSCTAGSGGCLLKRFTFLGKAAHAGGSPEKGINALYAAELAFSAVNALREIFKDSDHVRFHPIITEGGSSVNSIPDRVSIEAYLRTATMESEERYNAQINRAFAAAAAAMGCRLVIHDLHGYAPRHYDRLMTEVTLDAAREVLPADKVRYEDTFGSGCSDMGDVSCVMPVIHPHIGGYSGNGHGNDFKVTDPYLATVVSAKIQALGAVRFLENGAEKARRVIAQKQVIFNSIPEYLEAMDRLTFTAEAVRYEEDGTVSLRYKA